MSPLQTGRSPNGLLGASVAGCRMPGFVAGAPGENATLLVLDGGRWFDLPFAGPDAGVGIAVACEGGPTTLQVVSAGTTGVWTHSLAGTNIVLQPAPASALARGPTSSAPMLVGSPELGEVELRSWTGNSFPSLRTLTEAPGFGAALAWDPSGGFFAVGDPVRGSVRIYGWADGGLFDAGQIFGPPGVDFGGALAIADVHPNPGLELIVGATGSSQVFIYGNVMGQPGQVMVLDATAVGAIGGFGASLAVEPTPVAGTLHALWVGDPMGNRVFRFVGDAGEALQSTGGGAFGFSLAVTEQNLLIGAPFFSEVVPNRGAVYSVPFNTPVFAGTVPMECTNHSGCVTPTCQLGWCVGGVLCVLNGTPLCSAAQCVNGRCSGTDGGLRPDAGGDAGEPDAGRDGGAHGGPEDAGAPDAGSGVDGGPEREQFGTCGCSGAGAIPLVLLSVIFSRRARRRGR